MRVLRLSGLVLSVLAAALVLAACDSSGPIDRPLPTDVEGLYEFTEYSFTPRATAIEPANVLDTLVAGATTVELFGGGDVLFRFKVGDSPSALISGRFDVASDRIRFQFTDTQNRLPRLLLRTPITFIREGSGVLSHEEVTVVNLAAYDPQRYAGLTDVTGTLRVRLRRISPTAVGS